MKALIYLEKDVRISYPIESSVKPTWNPTRAIDSDKSMQMYSKGGRSNLRTDKFGSRKTCKCHASNHPCVTFSLYFQSRGRNVI